MATTVNLSTKAFVTKAEIREAIFVDSPEASRTDEELNTLYRMINDVCSGVEAFISGPVIQTSYTQTDDGGGEYVFLTTLPVVSVTTVKELGVSLSSGTDFVYDAEYAAVRRLSPYAIDAYTASNFASGTKAVEVVYVAGYGTQTTANGDVTAVVGVPEDFRLAAYIWLEHLWAKGPANYSSEQGVSTGSRAAIPYAVKEILRNRIHQVHWIGM